MNTLINKIFKRKYPEYAIIGDIHGEYDTFMNLLDEFDFHKQTKTTFILVGDVIDKGASGLECLRFIKEHSNRFIKVIGNHEHFVYKYLKGKIKLSKDKTFILNHMTSVEQYYNDREFKELLYWYYENGVFKYENNDFIVTHAPCKLKYLSNSDPKSEKYQRNFYMAREPEMSIEDEIEFIKEEKIDKYHIFGHIAWTKMLRCNKRIGIDLGACYGNYLGAVYFKNGRFYHKKIKSKRFKRKDKLMEPFSL